MPINIAFAVVGLALLFAAHHYFGLPALAACVLGFFAVFGAVGDAINIPMPREDSAAEVARPGPGACVIHERSPVDYLAYAAATRGTWSKRAMAAFLTAHVPAVRSSLRQLELIVLLPVSVAGPIRARGDEDARFRKRVDEILRRALVDDDYDLFGDGDSPQVVDLSPTPERQLSELIRLTRARTAHRC